MSTSRQFRSLLTTLVLVSACGDDSTSSTSQTDGMDASTSDGGSDGGDDDVVADSTGGGDDDGTTGSSSAAVDDTTTSEPSEETGSTGSASTGPGPMAECGDGVVEGDEECDDGPGNRETGACKPDCTLAYCGGTTGTMGAMRNVATWGNGNDMTGEGVMNITYTCSEEFLSVGAGNVIALSDPFVVGPDGELFLDQGSICVDNGTDASATADYGAIGLDWQTLTTSSGGVLDTTPVDMGAHYSP